MVEVDKSIISIFKSDHNQPEMMRSMRDIISLAGVMKDLSTEAIFDSPLEMLRFLRIIELINEEAYGLTDPIDNAETLYYRYQSRYQDGDPPSKARVDQIITILSKNNWISKQTHQIKMMSVGKRMMDALTRLANDSLAYYLEDEIGRSLFQARRDAEISEAYDDKGISGGNRIASMIRNVQDAIEKLEQRELELLADRNALPQLKLIHSLMEDLEQKLGERLNQFKTIEDSLVLSNLMQRGTGALTKGTSLSVGMINKYLQFMNVQQTPLKTTISPEKVRIFITQMFNPSPESEIPNAHQLFSFMDQGQYEGEELDGIWMPVKYASPLSPMEIEKGIEFLENYEPVVADIEEEIDTEFHEEDLEVDSLENLLDEASWLLTKASIDTEKIEQYLEQKKEADIEETMIETSSDSWSDAIRQLLGIAALEANKKIEIGPKPDVKEYEKEWEWIQDDARNQAFEEESNHDTSLNSLQTLRSVLTNREEQTFMSILFSSSATIRANNFGLSRKEVEKLLGVSRDDPYFLSFLSRVNQAVGRYYRLLYDEQRDQVVVMLRVPARSARHTLSEEALAVLLFMFYQQEVLKHDYTLLSQLLEAFGHEMLKGSRRIQLAIDSLRKIGAVENHQLSDREDAYRLTVIGVHMFSDSFLRRMVEFSHSNQLSKEDVMKFFNRYNLYEREGLF